MNAFQLNSWIKYGIDNLELRNCDSIAILFVKLKI
jgi:hypothetical protein